jgi:hypothetical protein
VDEKKKRARKKAPPRKETLCEICGSTVLQPRTGRWRQYCRPGTGGSVRAGADCKVIANALSRFWDGGERLTFPATEDGTAAALRMSETLADAKERWREFYLSNARRVRARRAGVATGVQLGLLG